MKPIESKKNISLVGFMASGKSSVGREAARRTGLNLVDFDEIIEGRLGMSVAEIFSLHGEERFRELETETLRTCCRMERQLLVPGGGILILPGNRKLLKETAYVIWLRIGIDNLMRRIRCGEEKETRPLLPPGSSEEEITALLSRRERHYRDCDFMIDVDGKEIAEVVEQVIESIRHLGF